MHRFKKQAPPELTKLKRLPIIFVFVSALLIAMLWSIFYPSEIWVLEDEVVRVSCNEERVHIRGRAGGFDTTLKRFSATTLKGYVVKAKECLDIQVGDIINFKEIKSRADSESSFVYLDEDLWK
ncbi:MAG: hypothetical protein JKY26_00850 [Pseudomonas sp.]|nr:hypothetical protein [Pseudomonas sp.]PHR97308.1 MAG: hypothetical protein COA68_12700 [Oceanobacter sp.]